jgi:PAS domain-containing protein
MSQQQNRVPNSSQATQEEAGKTTLVREVVSTGLRSREFYRLYILGLLILYCGLFYYFGEIVDFFHWEALHWEFFYGVHDIHRLLFLAPILYAAYVFGIRATIIITIISADIMLPRALFVSPYPDPMARMLITIAIEGMLGYLTARNLRETERRRRLEAILRGERDKLSGILERMEDGVAIIGPDYRIRFMNPSLVKDFGQGVGSYCYEVFYKSDAPCQQICKLPDVINGTTEEWQYTFPNGQTYEVLASPFVDTDGTVCQLATYRNITRRQKAEPQLLNSSNPKSDFYPAGSDRP